MNPLAISILSLIFCCSIRAENESHRLVTCLSGDLPIILSAPHGGQKAIPGVPPRQGKGVRDFKTKTDAETARLTEELADAIAKISGRRPYVVIARFHRKFVDANRAPKLAYESDLAKPVYDAYQQALAEACQNIMDRWGSGILLDIHGQSLAPDTIFRGTQQGKSTAHLVRRFGKEALTGGKSLFGQFARQGFAIDPPVGSLAKESHYSGGHIIATYGSAAGGTFDAIQIELGKNLRSATQRTQTVAKMATAITAFANDYLPKKEPPGNAKAKPKLPEEIMVGVYRDEGAGQSVNDLTRTLARFDNITIRNLMAADIQSGKLKEVDVLIHPGGSGGGQGRRLGEQGRERVREFGNGRVICFSPHPEMTKGLEGLLRHAIGFVNQGSSNPPIIP